MSDFEEIDENSTVCTDTNEDEPTCRDYYMRMGKYFGYPECCIENFIEHHYKNIHEKKWYEIKCWVKSDKVYKAYEKIGQFGYVPCDKHAQEIIDGKYKWVSEIFKNREAEKIVKKII